MAAPRELNIIKDCRLRIKVDSSDFKGIDHTDSSSPWKYEICPSQIKDNSIDKESFKGWLSPTYRVTLPPHAKELAKIPEKATTFAFMLPPRGLAEILTNDTAIEQKCRETLVCNLDDNPDILDAVTGILFAVTLGGFAYFDDTFECVGINALGSDTKSDVTLAFSGPFEVNQSACDELYLMERVQPLNLKKFREGGFVNIAWVVPREMFRFKQVFVNTNCHNDHGALLYFREDWTAVGYRVDPDNYVDPYGDVGVISEIFHTGYNVSEVQFDNISIQPVYEVNVWANKIKALGSAIDLIETLDDKKALVHHACHAALGADFVTGLLSNRRAMESIKHKDKFGWYPLHYACRFSPRDHHLIKFLLRKYPCAAMESDSYGRYPLHIACDSDTSEDVITALLAADTSTSKKTLLTGTKILGFLPIHFACYKGASDSIIKVLSDADIRRLSTNKRTACKQMPLHIAIIKKLPASTIRIFLAADLKRWESNRNFNSMAGIHQINGDSSDNGVLPLHLACWNNSSIEIIEMLLAKDEHNTTIDEVVPEILEDLPFHKDTKFPISLKSNIIDGVGAVALHLVMKHGSIDIIDILLQKEIERKYSLTSLHGITHRRTSTILKKDLRGRTPLHVACEHNVDPEIIKMLLRLDSNNQTTQMHDDQGFTPMHYACENKNTKTETIKILCAAEELHIKKESREEKYRSTHSRDIKRNRTPLHLAVKSGAPIDTIEILLQLENLVLDGFDDSAMKSLASLVNKNLSLQTKVVNKLSQRLYFVLNLGELYAFSIALVAFVWGSQGLKDGKNINPICAYLIFGSIGMFAVIAFLEMMSIGANYILSRRTWAYLASVVIAIYSACIMLVPISQRKDAENLLIVSVFSLTLNVIFYFRATFLPFAKFVGGVKAIIIKLTPFIVVSLLLLLGFIYCFWINKNEEKCKGELKECFKWTMGRLFTFKLMDDDGAVLTIEFFFMFSILMILLNVVIAIVSDAWDSSADASILNFWKFRLEKIYAMRFAESMLKRLCCSTNVSKGSYTLLDSSKGSWFLMDCIDSIWNTSYGDNDVSFWTKAPYSIVETKEQYDKPCFSLELSEKINSAKSLHSDLYWAEKKKGIRLTESEKFCIFLRWLGICIMYTLLIILGFVTFGVFWPRKFRLFALTLNYTEYKQIKTNSQ